MSLPSVQELDRISNAIIHVRIEEIGEDEGDALPFYHIYSGMSRMTMLVILHNEVKRGNTTLETLQSFPRLATGILEGLDGRDLLRIMIRHFLGISISVAELPSLNSGARNNEYELIYVDDAKLWQHRVDEANDAEWNIDF